MGEIRLTSHRSFKILIGRYDTISGNGLNTTPVATLPWISFGLLFASYTMFSWFLHETTETWFVWVLAVGFALSQALLLTAFSSGFKSLIDAWLRSDLGYFTSVVVGALFVAFAFVWINVFGYLLMIVASEMLARLDLQRLGSNGVQSLAVLTALSFGGLGTGWAISQYIPYV